MQREEGERRQEEGERTEGILIRVAVNNDSYTGNSFIVDGLIEDS